MPAESDKNATHANHEAHDAHAAHAASDAEPAPTPAPVKRVVIKRRKAPRVVGAGARGGARDDHDDRDDSSRRRLVAGFKTDALSPFPDGYSLVLEEADLAELLNAENPDDPKWERDPRYPRVEELFVRKKQLAQMKNDAKARDYANKNIPLAEARKPANFGALGSDTNTIRLHTYDGYQLFAGRSKVGDGSVPATHQIIGAAMAGGLLKQLWFMTGRDNPYADWALINATEAIDAALELIQATTKKHLAALADMREMGLNCSVLETKEPQIFSLTFQSPYGYLIAKLTVTYDYYARVLRSMATYDMMSKRDAQEEGYQMKKKLRAQFEQIARFTRGLEVPELSQLLCRADWAPDADAAARARVAMVENKFGPLLPAILLRQREPRHSRRPRDFGAQAGGAMGAGYGTHSVASAVGAKDKAAPIIGLDHATDTAEEKALATALRSTEHGSTTESGAAPTGLLGGEDE